MGFTCVDCKQWFWNKDPVQAGRCKKCNHKHWSKYFANQDRVFAERLDTGEWPTLICPECKAVSHCCCSYNHHVGDICTHCGNNERSFK